MALVVNDRVKETSTTTGTGTFSLAGAVSGFESFVTGIGNSNTTYYAVVNENGEFEVGLGTVTDADPDTLSRDTIISSSNSDSAVNFSAGTKNVFCTLPASKAVIEDANNHVTLPHDLFIEGGLIDLKNDGGAVSQIKFYCESSNAHAQTLIGAPHSESATNTLTLPSTGGDARLVSTASTATLTNKTLTSAVLNSTISGTSIKDEDNMASDSASHLATQQSIKSYVDTQVATIPVGDITSVVAGTNLSGGGTSGDVTLNLADASTSAKGAASFSSDNFAASSGAITIKDLGVATAEIQNDAVTQAKIADDAVGADQLAANAVVTSSIVDANVTTAKVADNAITLAKMASGTDGNIISYDASGDPVAVATGKAGQVLTSAGAGAPPTFQTPTVGDITSVVAGTNLTGGGTSGDVTLNLADASTSAKGAASFSSDNFAASSGAITIKDAGVATAEIQDDAVTTAKIADSNITVAKMAANSVDSNQYVDGSIDTAHIANDQITNALMADNAIDTAQIADNAVSLAKMASGTDGNIISYDASGNPVAIATGSSGQVLTSGGAGAQPSFQTPTVGDITGVTAGTLLDGGGTSGDVTLNVDLSELSTSTSDGDGDFFVVVDSSNNQKKLTKGNINNSGFNNDAGYTTNTGDITSVVAGSGLTGGATSGAATLNIGAGNLIDVQADQVDVDLSELTTSTSDGDGDFFVVVDSSNAQKKLTKGNINNSGFNNDAGYTTNTGDITSVVAGSGLTGGATSGAATLNIGAGTGIDVAADAISVDVSDFMANGSNNRIVTATGADAQNAEANLTFDGSTLAVTGAITTTGNITTDHVLPQANDTYDLGASDNVWRHVYTGDLHLSNEAKAEGNAVDGTKGNWTIQEGEEHLFILNNKNGKKYRFELKEM